MNPTSVLRKSGLQVIITGLILVGIAGSVGCAPLLPPGGGIPANPNLPRVSGSVNSDEQSTAFWVSVVPPIVYYVRWSIGDDLDGWYDAHTQTYDQTYVMDYLSLHNWDVLPDTIQDNFSYGYSTNVEHHNYSSPQTVVLLYAWSDGADCRSYTIQLPYYIACSGDNHTWSSPTYHTLGSVGFTHGTGYGSTDISWVPQ